MKRTLLLLVMSGMLMGLFSFQIMKTKLQITVMDGVGNYQSNAEVTLYETKADYEAEKNPVAEAMKTDKKGKVIFKELEAQSYFVKVVKGDKNNVGGAEQTSDLLPNKMNKVNIIIY